MDASGQTAGGAETGARCGACRSSVSTQATRCPACRARVNAGAVLHRGHPNKTLTGVCAGLAAYFDLDVVLVRIVFVLGLVGSLGLALALYALLWAFMPKAPGARAPLQSVVDWATTPAPEATAVPRSSDGGEPRF